MCLSLFSTVASWLHSQGALELCLQADDASAHCRQATPAQGEKTESLTWGTLELELKETSEAIDSRSSQALLCVSITLGAC